MIRIKEDAKTPQQLVPECGMSEFSRHFMLLREAIPRCILMMFISTIIPLAMALQIANPKVVNKVELLAKATGLSKTAVVERALDRLISEISGLSDPRRMAALLAQFDRVPDREDAFDPLEWDAQGLPK